VVLAAWRGIKVNERASATYYFSPLAFCRIPLARTPAIPSVSLSTVNPPSSLFILAIGHAVGLLLAKIGPPRIGEKRAARDSGGGRTRKEKERERKRERERDRRRRRAKCNEREEDAALSGRDRAKVLRGRGKWQTLSCHEALDVFILPQAVLEERSLRCAIRLDRPSARARARAAISRDPLNSYVTWTRRTPGFDRRRRRATREIRETEFRGALSTLSPVNLTPQTCRSDGVLEFLSAAPARLRDRFSLC